MIFELNNERALCSVKCHYKRPQEIQSSFYRSDIFHKAIKKARTKDKRERRIVLGENKGTECFKPFVRKI